ncbi:MAG: translation elongation factor Ts [Planctomycetota bacterium]|nr:translation elongation factor Ts [Planctomycetota bacterium]
MAEITAAAVKSLRDKTGLPMMECKKALKEVDGDEDAAIKALREAGKKLGEIRKDRATSEGRIAVYFDANSGAMIELQCESAPVASHEEFIALANDLARQLATGPGAATPDELFAQSSPSREGMTLGDVKDDLFNRIREVFNLARLVRIDAPCGGYTHHAGVTKGVLLEIEGDNAEAAKDICMHITATDPAVIHKEDLDPAEVDKERQILSEAARKEGKPENIIEKMVEGRMRQFYATKVLCEQPFVKDDTQTVAKYAEGANIKLVRFVSWELGKDG